MSRGGESEPELLAQGVWLHALRTPTLPPATTTNTLVIAGDRCVVVEPGTPHADQQARLGSHLDALERSGCPLAAVIVTHHHSDHVGGASWLARTRGVEVLAHPETSSRLEFRTSPILEHGFCLDLGGGVELSIRETPGHAPGHVVVHEHRSGLSHVGDMVAGTGSVLIDPDDGGHMCDYLDSLRALVDGVEAGDGQRWVPAHGPLQTDPRAIGQRYIAHRLAREAKVLAALESGGASSRFAILERAYADTPVALHGWADKALRAHLERLARQGRVVLDDGLWRVCA